MQGFRIHVETPDSLEDIQFRLYDNDVLVVDNIAVVDFDYLITEPYEGQHKLDLKYFQTWNPTLESSAHNVLDRSFTLPALTLITSYEIL